MGAGQETRACGVGRHPFRPDVSVEPVERPHLPSHTAIVTTNSTRQLLTLLMTLRRGALRDRARSPGQAALSCRGRRRECPQPLPLR